MKKPDSPRSLAAVDVVQLALREDRRTHGPRHDRREQDPDDEDDDEWRRAEHDQRQQPDEDDRKGEECLDEAAEDVIDGPR